MGSKIHSYDESMMQTKTNSPALAYQLHLPASSSDWFIKDVPVRTAQSQGLFSFLF